VKKKVLRAKRISSHGIFDRYFAIRKNNAALVNNNMAASIIRKEVPSFFLKQTYDRRARK